MHDDKVIWKFPVQTDSLSSAIRPNRHVFRVLHAGLDPSGTPCIWAEVCGVETESVSTINTFVVLTGGQAPARADYVGTILDGSYVLHIYAAVV